jgi:hypothetical protein
MGRGVCLSINHAPYSVPPKADARCDIAPVAFDTSLMSPGKLTVLDFGKSDLIKARRRHIW